MKKVNLSLILVALCLCVFNSVIFSQVYGIKDNVFSIPLESGIGVEYNVNFLISNETIEAINSNEAFKHWDSVTFSNPKNANFIEVNKNHTHFETFLFSTLNMASFNATYDLKNPSSYTIIENSQGIIYVKENKINFSFPFKAQNGYGTMIFMKAYYTLEYVNGENKSTHFVN